MRAHLHYNPIIVGEPQAVGAQFLLPCDDSELRRKPTVRHATSTASYVRDSPPSAFSPCACCAFLIFFPSRMTDRGRIPATIQLKFDCNQAGSHPDSSQIVPRFQPDHARILARLRLELDATAARIRRDCGGQRRGHAGGSIQA